MNPNDICLLNIRGEDENELKEHITTWVSLTYLCVTIKNIVKLHNIIIHLFQYRISFYFQLAFYRNRSARYPFTEIKNNINNPIIIKKKKKTYGLHLILRS